jgi:glycosyltransferase involved in cell wall biosynthesis
MAHGLETLLEAAETLQSRCPASQIRILFLGDGAEKAALKARASEMNLRNVLFIDSVPKEEVVRWWSLLDVSIIHLKKTELFSTVIPSKLFESMGMGIPVLHGVAGESADIVRRENVGRTFDPENAKSLADLLVQAAGNLQMLDEWRRNCVLAAQKYDRSALAASMLDILSKVARAGRRS